MARREQRPDFVFYLEFIETYLPRGSIFEITSQEIVNNIAYIVWIASSREYSFPIGSDTLVIQENKIKTHTFVAQIKHK